MGMEMAGHKCVGYVEIDKYARQSYEAIHNTKGEWTSCDIRTVDHRELPNADCYCGGFPCQTFSVAGKRGGFTDTRGTLFFEIMRLAKERKPKYLFLENVAGLLSHDGGRTFGTIIQTLYELGYDAEWQVLNSKDFGVPQNRERVFIIGHLGGGSGRKVFPIREIDIEVVGANEGLAMVGMLDMKGNECTRRVYHSKGIAPSLTTMQGGHREPKVAVRACLTPDRLKKRQDGPRFKGEGEDMFTLTAQDRHGVCVSKPNGYRIRKLTPLECWRLQGFPDWAFQKAKGAGASDSQLYKQAGNSVTVNVIREIAKRLEVQK